MPPTGFTPNNVWAESSPVGVSEELKLPSGQMCLARKIGMEGLLEAGILDQVDSLTALVDTEHVKKARNKGNEVDVAALVKNGGGDTLKAIITVADKAIPMIVESPVVRLHYITSGTSTRMLTADEREPGIIYTDQIGLEDKMFLFDWAIGDMAAMRAFRDGTTADVAGVADVPGVSRPTKRSAARKR